MEPLDAPPAPGVEPSLYPLGCRAGSLPLTILLASPAFSQVAWMSVTVTMSPGYGAL